MPPHFREHAQLEPGVVTRFDARTKPAISVQQYLERVCKYAPCSNQCYTMCLIYLERVTLYNPQVFLTSINVHRFLITR